MESTKNHPKTISIGGYGKCQMALRKFQMILPRHQILFPEKKDGNMLWGLDP